MSIHIEPSETMSFGEESVDRYQLPIGFGNTLLSIDASSGDVAYVAEWKSSEGLTGFRKLAERHLEPVGDEAVAWVETDKGPAEAKFSDITDLGEDGFPQGCSSLSVRSVDYDISWEKWDDSNLIVLTSYRENPSYIENYFPETVSEDMPEQVVNKTMRQAKQVIEEQLPSYE